MLSFATEFPVNHEHTVGRFFETVRDWFLGSPHTVFTGEDLAAVGSAGEWNVQRANERLHTLSYGSGTREQGAARYTRSDLGLEWVTTIVFSRWENDSWVSMRITCESSHPAVRLPPAKKPVLVRLLLKSLGGASDGALGVGITPYRLDNVDVDIAAQLIAGRASCRLPIVYISACFQGGWIVDPDRLANDLSGMAHIVVEPNRAFSLRLKIDVKSENVYGGTIGIYWPEGAGRRAFFLGREYDSAASIQSAVVEEVQSALANRRPLERSTWAASQALVSRSTFEALRAAGSQEVMRYVEEFDKELAAKAEEVEHAEREIARLRAELRRYEARPAMGSGLMLSTGSEQDLYRSELADIVCDAIRDASQRTLHDSRRQHVLSAIIEANPPGGEALLIRGILKDLLRGSTGIDSKVRRGLEGLGFVISEEGKHYKLVFQGDDRYTFVLPKTGSDSRGGLNAANDIGRLLL